MTPHTEPAHGPEPAHDHGVRAEEDRIATGKIVAVGAVSLVLFFIASAFAVSYFHTQHGERPWPPTPPEIGQSKIGIVEQSLFELQVRGVRDRAAKLERLRSYGWVDRDAGVVHVPIDRAMELVARGIRPAPEAPPPSSGPGAQP